MQQHKTFAAILCALLAAGQVYAHPADIKNGALEKRATTTTIPTTTKKSTTMTTSSIPTTTKKTYQSMTNPSSISTTVKTTTTIPTTVKTTTGTQATTVTTKAATTTMAFTTTKPASTTKSISASSSSTTIDSSSSRGDVTQAGKCYKVRGVGSFGTKKVYDFTSGGSIPNDLVVSNYNIPDMSNGNPWNHGFKTRNVYILDGKLNLRVPGRQNPATDSNKSIYGGEVYTAEGGILYGSVRTRAIFDDTPGTCQGIFSYHDDTNEIDIEYLSNRSSIANPDPNQPPVLWYTNQPGNEPDNQITNLAPSDVDSAVHEYRIDWTADWTKFYIDGVLQNTLTGSVPHVGSQWVWNNWANGNPYWSTGPPINDNVMKIESIVMYYNTADNPTCDS